ncbi:MAG: nucleotide exchange factor GrpE [Bacteroidota bacterium]|nr:nucleotide exchange factor GrpE [Bacteroidota bacterium]
MAKKSEKAEKQQGKKIEVEETVKQEKVQEEPVEKETPEETEAEEKEEPKKEPTTEEKLAELQDRYLRLSAEYDNFRKRTLKEKIDLQKSANENLLEALLPVADDFDRAMQSVDEAKDVKAVKEGMQLISGKFLGFLNQQGVKEIQAQSKKFDTDLHEAITKIPAPSKKLKGKVVDVIQKGYFLNDKVLRFSKVVIGE